jgi:hypothetical protein
MNTTPALTEIPTDSILKTAGHVKKIAYVIAAIGTVASYGTQVTLLLNNHFKLFSYVIPGTIDLLALGAAMALQIPRLDTVSRKIAGAILTVAVVVSIVANVWEAETGIQAAGHAWPVVAYLLGELLANRIRAFAERLIATREAAIAPVAVVAPVAIPTPQVAVPLPVATTTTRTKAAPTASRRGSHAGCAHVASPAARAACRSTRTP